MMECTAIGNLGHCLNQDCDRMTIYFTGASDGEPNENEVTFLPSLKLKLLLRHLAAKFTSRTVLTI